MARPSMVATAAIAEGPSGRKHLRGVSTKEQGQYEHIKDSARRTGRYGNQVKEVAARTVLKQHAEKGHSKGR
jgi:hypothetical protein